MHFEKGIWSLLVIGICFITKTESAVSIIPGPLNTTAGGTISFKWNSTVNILDVTWGIRSGNLANPHYITVDNTGPSYNPTLDANPSLKRRLHFTGNIAAGQAWFNITEAILNDTNEYIALIVEGGASAPVPYYVHVFVTAAEEPTTATPSITPSTTIGTIGSSTTKVPGPSPAPNNGTSIPATEPPGCADANIVGFVIGLIIAALIIIAVIIFICKRKKEKKELNTREKVIIGIGLLVAVVIIVIVIVFITECA